MSSEENDDISDSSVDTIYDIYDKIHNYKLADIKLDIGNESGFREINKNKILFDEKKYFSEMSKNLDLYANEKNIEFDNQNSFTKEVDNKIMKYYYRPINGSNLNILMIAEKPSIAYTITKILSKNKFNKYEHQTMKLYTFKGLFKGIKSFFTVTSVKGHIYDNKYEYEIDKNHPEESYHYNMIKCLKNNKINIPAFLRYIAKDKDILCLWIDCDPEGENICYEIIHNVLINMNIKNYQQIYRAEFLL